MDLAELMCWISCKSCRIGDRPTAFSLAFAGGCGPMYNQRFCGGVVFGVLGGACNVDCLCSVLCSWQRGFDMD